MNKIKEIINGQWEWIKYTKLGKMIYSLALAFGCFALANIWDIMFYVAWVFMIYPLGLFCVMMVYAWVINPIRDWKESKKMREEYQKNQSVTPVTQPEVKTATETKTEEPAPVQKKKKGASKKKKDGGK